MAVQTRPNWNVSEIEAGSVGNNDNGALQVSAKVKTAEVELQFGVIVLRDGIDVRRPALLDTAFFGVSLIDNKATNYATKKYAAEDLAAIGRRGFFAVQIDPANKPAASDTTFNVSVDAGKEGWLTGGGGTELAVTSGMYIEQVLDNVAIVYLDGTVIS